MADHAHITATPRRRAAPETRPMGTVTLFPRLLEADHIERIVSHLPPGALLGSAQDALTAAGAVSAPAWAVGLGHDVPPVLTRQQQQAVYTALISLCRLLDSHDGDAAIWEGRA